MAIPGNTRQTYGAVQIREDLSNIIYNISPTDTPFVSGIGRGTASNTLFQWQKDALAAAAVNRKFEGDTLRQQQLLNQRCLTIIRKSV